VVRVAEEVIIGSEANHAKRNAGRFSDILTRTKLTSSNRNHRQTATPNLQSCLLAEREHRSLCTIPGFPEMLSVPTFLSWEVHAALPWICSG
jgi:hypothetical protein